MSRASTRTIAALLFASSLASAGNARAPAPKAEAIVAAAKLATGGAAWDKLQGCIEEGTHDDGAVSYRTRFSLRDYGMRIDSERSGQQRSMGFNGKVRWQSTADGKVDIVSDPAAIKEATLTNYLSINGFFFPDRFPATFKYLRSAEEGGKSFDVVEISPKGGRALEVWFNGRSHLIGRVVDTYGSPAVRVEASDYRKVDGLTVAYKLEVFTPDGAVADRGVLTSFHCGAIDSSIFEPPAAK
ncbi:hypothetical protein GCM10007973_00180 [Polymorphobacter multimanifer]|uniref:Outer membrane lipoprotein carrier protein LolA n=1 Tax=Polymorphobacter multimanifer TaxID=1070431 RepID=A0A841L1Y2_9SPHN|nr:hypothetical protein [Polymorphobacter multimanifer]MBB6226809.1 hypothetical protein [Polymorphobacter multimanifer]GGI67049.1 hypothetical protein GCM10007973_00180 [Polymorphobacter multimanifer]